MSDENSLQKPESKAGTQQPTDHVAGAPLPADIKQLPKEVQAAFSMALGMFRSSTGPDPETAKILAEAEMHGESCKLEAYKNSLRLRDTQNERDHQFRIKKMNHETAKSFVFMAACVGAIICGLYEILSKHNNQVGTPIVVVGFTGLLGRQPSFGKDKE